MDTGVVSPSVIEKIPTLRQDGGRWPLCPSICQSLLSGPAKVLSVYLSGPSRASFLRKETAGMFKSPRSQQQREGHVYTQDLNPIAATRFYSS